MGRLFELPLFDPASTTEASTTTTDSRRSGSGPGATRPLPRSLPSTSSSCATASPGGVWLPGDESALLLNGIDLVAFHRGMYEQGEVPGAWFGWRAREHGFTPTAAGSAVTLFERGRAPAAAPPAGAAAFAAVLLRGLARARNGGAPGPDLGVRERDARARRELARDHERPALGRRRDARELLSVAAPRSATSLDGERWHAVVLEVPSYARHEAAPRPPARAWPSAPGGPRAVLPTSRISRTLEPSKRYRTRPAAATRSKGDSP